MRFKETDFQQADRIAELIQFCDTADLKTLEQITDEIYQHQPFLTSLLMGYKAKVDMLQLDEILRALIIIWLFFRENEKVKRSKITVKMFESLEKKNVSFLRYLGGETTGEAQKNTISANLDGLQSKALFSALLIQFKEGPT